MLYATIIYAEYTEDVLLAFHSFSLKEDDVIAIDTFIHSVMECNNIPGLTLSVVDETNLLLTVS